MQQLDSSQYASKVRRSRLASLAMTTAASAGAFMPMAAMSAPRDAGPGGGSSSSTTTTCTSCSTNSTPAPPPPPPSQPR